MALINPVDGQLIKEYDIEQTNGLNQLENNLNQLETSVLGGGTLSRRVFSGTTDASGLLKVADRFAGEGSRFIILPNLTNVGTNTGHNALNFLGVGSIRNDNGYFIKVLRATNGEILAGVNCSGVALLITF